MVTVVPMVVAMVMVVVLTALFTPVVAVLWRCGLPCHHGGLVVGHRLHHTVLRLGRVVGDGLRVVGHHLGVAVSMVLAGDAGTDQTAGTGAHDGAIAAPDLVADGRTSDGTDTGTQNGVKVIRMGCGGQAGQAASEERKGQNTCCVHGVVWAWARTAKRSGLSSFNATACRSMTG